MADGLFITLEGPDGAGKSSQMAMLAQRLRDADHTVVDTREPGGTPLGELVRSVLLETAGGTHDALSDALLFNAARRRLTEQVIGPALASGAIVICDRYADSTLAYQGYGGGAALELLRTLSAIATGGLAPLRTVLIDLPVAAGLERRRGGEPAGMTRFELADEHGRTFHERVRNGYLALAAEDKVRWRVIDGAAAPETVAERVWAAVSDLVVGG